MKRYILTKLTENLEINVKPIVTETTYLYTSYTYEVEIKEVKE